jgi:septum site-determining protein MinC
VYELDKKVTLKGTNEGYLLKLNDRASWDGILEDLNELFKHLKLDNKHDQAFDLTIDSGNRLLVEEEKTHLSDLIEENTNFKIKDFNETVMSKELAKQWHRESTPYVAVTNVRNGQIIRSDRDIILIGDVRPGGMVRSAGNIMVIGEIQGILHAGANGNEDAVIIAPFAYNGQVRLGEHIEIIENKEEPLDAGEPHAKHQVVFLNDLHVIEFADVGDLKRIRPDFAKELGGFEAWQKQL